MLSGLDKLVRLIEREPLLREYAKAEVLCEISSERRTYPIFGFTIGKGSAEQPVLFLTGGVHGLERIGAQLAWSLLKTTLDRILWDQGLRNILNGLKLVVVPLVNPVGYDQFKRSNGHGVDLMRNSPIDAVDRVPHLLGGQRWSSKLPWYRGQQGELELENQALQKIFDDQVAPSQCVVSVDFHSGFGMRDRLWFPYSYKKEAFENLAELHALTHLFEESHPYHIYLFEPQSAGYLLNGDMWDYLYRRYREKNNQGVFVPLTLEMGSWNWVKKNPLQIFSKDGVFNPIREHRIKRTYRRHHLLFDFLLRAVYSNQIWSQLEQHLKTKHQALASERWYS